MPERTPTNVDPWAALRRLTSARIALGRAGSSLPTTAHLQFQLAHARARDAVHQELDAEALRLELQSRGLEVELVHSQAADRRIFLQRPDQGRRLDQASRHGLRWRAKAGGIEPPCCDLILVLADGLSARAVQDHGLPLLEALFDRLSGEGWTTSPLVIARQARVALGDEIAELLGATMVVVLIGERPGLSSPDSLGAYLTWAPRIGTPDSARNCLSNIRPEGLPVAQAADRLAWLLREARRRRVSGVDLKEDCVDVQCLPGDSRVLPPPLPESPAAAADSGNSPRLS